MGRRHVIAAAAAGAALATAAPAAAALHWHELVRGAAAGVQPSAPVAYLALDRRATARFTPHLPPSAAKRVAGVDLARSAVVAVFGEFGCTDGRVHVSSVVQRGRRLVVSLVRSPLPPGQAECLALFPTFRVLTLPKTELRRPYPARAEALLARA